MKKTNEQLIADFKKSNKERRVDPRQLNYLILKGVKYIVK